MGAGDHHRSPVRKKELLQRRGHGPDRNVLAQGLLGLGVFPADDISDYDLIRGGVLDIGWVITLKWFDSHER
jgi:hypothetical protein